MQEQARAIIPTKWGSFHMIAFSDSKGEKMPHVVMMHEDCDIKQPVLVRIHSECLTGDLFGSHRCECGEQLERALELAAENGGILVYLRQEGRGIGLINKLKAYQLQDTGLNTIDANVHLGFEPDERHYDDAIEILENLGIKEIKLLTNNPLKLKAIEQSNIKLIDRVPLVIQTRKENEGYMRTKSDLMGHLLNGK